MPSLGADMEYGYLVEWLVKPGDIVSRGDIVAEVETEKGVIEIEIWVDGVIDRLLVEPGRDEIPVGSVLALVKVEDAEAIPQAVPAPVVTNGQVRQPEPVDVPERAQITPVAVRAADCLGVDTSQIIGTGPHGKITLEDVERAAEHLAAAAPQPVRRKRVSPAARRLAQELGVNLDALSGTGPDGAISREDVQRAASKASATGDAAPDKSAAGFQEGMRRAIARAMARSNREIPHYYLETSIDMTVPLTWLEKENTKRSIKDRLLPAVLYIKAVARTLQEVPQLNGFWVDDHLEMQANVHVGFAIALREGGLVTPAIHNADTRTMDELMISLRDLITRTRTGKLRGSEMTDSTVTLTSLGDLGVETVFGVIYPPQVALVGLGRVTEIPWAQDGMLGIRRVMKVTIAGDHRATDGRVGAQFLEKLTKNLMEPDKL
ncbi:MAG: 2-oxo acid dehydrogenase subunit E2 [Chloroflexota bacterium]